MKRLDKYAEKQFSGLLTDLKQLVEDANPAAIHDARVRLKKIKAMLRLLDYTLKRFRGHREWIPFRTIFRGLAQVRQSDVMVELLLKFQVEGLHDQITDVDSNQALENLKKILPAYITTVKKRRRHLKPLVANIQGKQVREFIHERDKEIKKQLYPAADMANIHKTRKAIKEVIYLSETLHASSKRKQKFYKSLEQIIGNLHDKQTLLAVLRTHRSASHDAKRELIRSACMKDEMLINRLAYRYYA